MIEKINKSARSRFASSACQVSRADLNPVDSVVGISLQKSLSCSRLRSSAHSVSFPYVVGTEFSC